MRGEDGQGQIRQVLHNDRALTDLTKRKFTDHERMGEDSASIEKIGQRAVPAAQMVYPD